MDPKQTLEELEEALADLREENKTTPIIVEGEKDVAALRVLQLPGKIIRFNKGQSVSDFCDMIVQNHRKVILLTDWDRRGGRLCLQLKKNLENRIAIDLSFRGVFAKRCPCRTVEGMPSWLATLRRKVERLV
ncbi:MAG TPA: toprim domain-containing protein [Candidatus Thermoplasmatota archaeon]|nr:toprim domain-containing protein [Candidatus Thermoplasmatota archaeon]